MTQENPLTPDSLSKASACSLLRFSLPYLLPSSLSTASLRCQERDVHHLLHVFAARLRRHLRAWPCQQKDQEAERRREEAGEGADR